MGVEILEYTTKEPITMIGKMAGICYNANTEDKVKNYQRGLDCIISDHGRTLEFPKVYLLIDEASAKCLREIYVHIVDATRLQASTRYIEYGNFNYITPPSVKAIPEAEAIFDYTINTIKTAMEKLKELGVPKEDYSNLLPLCYESKMVAVYGLRELIAMSRVRECSRVYWEFRNVMKELKTQLRLYSSEWAMLVDGLNVFHAKCEDAGYCKEKFSCGRMPKKGELKC